MRPALRLVLGLAARRGSGVAGATYREITIDNTGGAAKTDWPVQVALTSADFTFADVESDGSNLEFRATDGSTELDYWRQDWDSVGETGTLWVKVPSIGAGATATVRMYYGAGITDRSNGNSVFNAYVDFSDLDQVRGSVDDDGHKTLFNASTLAVIADISGATEIREQDSVVYDPDDPNLATYPERLYKLYITASVAPSGKRLYVLFSADGVTFGAPQACTMDTTNPRDYEDPSVCTLLNTPGRVHRDGSGKMHLYCEDNSSNAVYAYESVDGLSWTGMSGNPVIPLGAGGTWDAALAGSPCAVFDGTNYIVGYEGIDATPVDKFGIAVGTSPNSLTKSASNPLLAVADHASATGQSVVVDAMWLTDDGLQIKLLAHDGGPSGSTMFGWKTSNVDPATWTNADFAEDGDLLDPAVRSNPTIHYGNKHQIVTCPSNTSVVLCDVSTEGAAWAIDRIPNSGGGAGGFVQSPVAITAGELVMTVSDPVSNDFALVIRTPADIGLPNNFQIMARAKQTENRAGMGFGTGALGAKSTAASHRPDLASGYQAVFLDFTSTGLRIAEYAADHTETIDAGSALSSSNAQAYHVRTFSYLSTGALAVAVNTSTRTGTDSTFLAGNKKIYYYQGQRATSDDGGVTTVDWICVRRYDGVDPVVTVGSEI